MFKYVIVLSSAPHSSNQFHTQPGSSSTSSRARTSPVGRPVLPVPDRTTYCQLLGGGALSGGLYSPTSPKVSQVELLAKSTMMRCFKENIEIKKVIVVFDV